MGKGGRTDTNVRLQAEEKAARLSGWKSPYNPLDPKAPELPTKGEIKAVIPKHCFERSYFTSLYYLFRDVTMAAAFAYATSLILSTDLPDLNNYVEVAKFVFGWIFYGFWQGTILTGPWVLGHECGHGAFSPSQTFNDFFGFFIHHALLVPYFAWQYTHAKHHRRTNHLTDGESHVPDLPSDQVLGGTNKRLVLLKILHETFGDDAFALFQVWSHLAIGWPLYLLGAASTGKLDQHGEPLNGRIADHFRPGSPMFPSKMSFKVLVSSITVFLSLAGLVQLSFKFGFLPVFLWYWNPYFFTNAWLVLYTWLQHTDPSVPHYGADEWTWVKGALGTIDRPYGIFDFFHHHIGSTHVTHHLFHELPHYNAVEATKAIRAFLEPKGLYNYDPTPWIVAMWKIAHTCHYMDADTGIQYFKSLEDSPLTMDLKPKVHKKKA